MRIVVVVVVVVVVEAGGPPYTRNTFMDGPLFSGAPSLLLQRGSRTLAHTGIIPSLMLYRVYLKH